MEKLKNSILTAGLVKNLTFISLIVMTFGTLLTNYTKQIYTQTISFFVADGWCNSKTQGIGIHCFGDFYAPVHLALTENPWSGDLRLAYTPINFQYFHLITSPLITKINPHLPIFLNIGFTLICLSIPGIHMILSDSTRLNQKGPWFLMLSLVSVPCLMMIDRGSSSFLLFPLLYGFAYNVVMKPDRKMASLFLILMVLWKPQSLILALVLLSAFGVIQFLKVSTVSIAALAGSFILYPSNMFLNFKYWLSNSIKYQNYAPNPSPGNYSFADFLGYLHGIFRWLFTGGNSLKAIFRPALAHSSVSTICGILLVLILFSIIPNLNHIETSKLFLGLNLFLIVLPGTSFGYYLAMLLIPLALIDTEPKSQLNILGILQKWSTVVLLMLIVPAWPLSWQNLGIPMVGTVKQIVSVQSTFAQFLVPAISICYLVEFLFSRKLHSSRVSESGVLW